VTRPFRRGTRELSAFLSLDDDDSVWDLPAEFQASLSFGALDLLGPIQSRLQIWLTATGVASAGVFGCCQLLAGQNGLFVGPVINFAGNVVLSLLRPAQITVPANQAGVSLTHEDLTTGTASTFATLGAGADLLAALPRGTTVINGTVVGVPNGITLLGASNLWVDAMYVPPGSAFQMTVPVANVATTVLVRAVEPLVFQGTPQPR